MTRFTERGITVTHIECSNDDRCAVTADIQLINEAVAVEAWNKRSGTLAQAKPDPASDQEIQRRLTHHALVSLYKLCKTLGNFKNGVEHNGIDEGEVYASGIFDHVEAVLRGTALSSTEGK